MGIKAADATELTALYIQFRMANKLEKWTGLFAKNITMHIDLSKAGPLVATRVSTALGFKTDLSGLTDVANYFTNFPAERGDVMPKRKAFDCTGNACTIIAKVSRPIVGNIKDVLSLAWDLAAQRILHLNLTLSIPSH